MRLPTRPHKIARKFMGGGVYREIQQIRYYFVFVSKVRTSLHFTDSDMLLVINVRASVMLSRARAADHSGRAVFVRSNTGIVGSNHTRGVDVCVLLSGVCAILCAGSGFPTG
jgi:hypothetical protein